VQGEFDMKKYILGIIPLVMLVTVCASNSAASGGKTLDQAIKEAATRIDAEVGAGSKIALLNFNSPSDRFSSYVLDELTANLLDTKKMTVVDRKEVDLIRGELGFQFSGEVGDDSIQKLGRMLGAQSIVSGSLTEIGGDYRIVIRVLNVQTASVAVQYRSDIAADKRVKALLQGGRSGGTAAASNRASGTGGGQAAASQPAAKTYSTTYNIGDKGPAGGIIFYDKFSSVGGWRYLEAAPKETEQQFPWGNVGFCGTSVALGDGKRNTQIIAEELRNNKIGGAAQYCNDLEYGGYDDWFLPSKDELNLMYQNLKEKGLGSFTNNRYWSSSEGNYNGAWYQRFNNGEQNAENSYTTKGQTYCVRAVRAF
jgi:TolB-like protein